MRYLIAVILGLLGHAASAQDLEDRQVFNPAGATSLRIISSTDTDLFAPLIHAFIAANSDIAVEYLVTGTADLDTRFRDHPQAFDIAISSAMAITAGTDRGVACSPRGIPRQVGTYDVRQSGLGCLFATQDARASETFWRLMEVMGSLNVRLYCCSGDMIDDLTDGTIAVAYNVLGSYAEARVEGQSSLEIVLPSDIPTTMMRTALVSQVSRNPDIAERFMHHLVTHQADASHPSRTLPPLQANGGGAERATIALEPALTSFLDSLKRSKFLSGWESALIQQ